VPKPATVNKVMAVEGKPINKGMVVTIKDVEPDDAKEGKS
jgi:hypothetical protein